MDRDKLSKVDLIKYSDLSVPEDDRLHLVGTLFLQCEGELEGKEAKRIGELIHFYLMRKKALENCFLGLSDPLNDDQESRGSLTKIQRNKGLNVFGRLTLELLGLLWFLVRPILYLYFVWLSLKMGSLFMG